MLTCLAPFSDLYYIQARSSSLSAFSDLKHPSQRCRWPALHPGQHFNLPNILCSQLQFWHRSRAEQQHRSSNWRLTVAGEMSPPFLFAANMYMKCQKSLFPGGGKKEKRKRRDISPSRSSCIVSHCCFSSLPAIRARAIAREVQGAWERRGEQEVRGGAFIAPHKYILYFCHRDFPGS